MMKNLILGIALVLMFTSVKGNNDSLWNIWNDQTKPKITRLNSIYELNKTKYIFNNPDSGFIMAELQYDLAKSLPNNEGLEHMGNALVLKGLSANMRGIPEKALNFYKEALAIRQDIGDKRGVASCINNIGIIYDDRGNYNMAIDYFQQSLAISTELDDKPGMAMAYSNIGNIFSFQGDNSKAIEYYMKSLKIQEASNDKHGIAYSLNNIGIIYKNGKSFDKALEYYQRSLKLNEEIGSKSGVATSLTNLGILYETMGESEKALQYFVKSLQIKEEIKDQFNIPISLINIAQVYHDRGNFEKALDYLQKSLKIYQDINDKKGESISLLGIGDVFLSMKKYDEAIKYCNAALSISQEINVVPDTRNAAEILYKIYKIKDNTSEALKMHELFISMRDSVQNEKQQKEIIRQGFKYEYEKQKALDDKENEKKVELEIEKQKRQKFIMVVVILAGSIVLILLIIIYRRLKVTRIQKIIIQETNEELNQTNEELAAQRDEIESQKSTIEEAHKDLQDSITYAKRIQSAILPPDSLLKESLKNHFVLYQPKDVVAGDFYWFEQVESVANKGTYTTLFAAADCTGHGVPGAMVSVVCHNALNRSVREFGLTNPASILDKTREIVLAEFSKSEEDVKDGMDIALCSISGNTLQYAGANNPLWIIRNNELIEFKADRQPVGKSIREEPFAVHETTLQKNDVIYIFSDGFQDQFGGEHDKKYGKRQLREYLLAIHAEELANQKEMLLNEFTTWRTQANSKQIDDVCVIGIKI